MSPYEQGYFTGLAKVGMDIPFEHILASAKASGLEISPELQQIAEQGKRARTLKHLLTGGAIGGGLAGLGLGGYSLYQALKDK